jgi:Tfp pilus assembly protein PilV
VNNGKQKGIALITALLILLLISSIIIGLSWMVMTDNRLGGSNADRQNAFYGAEAGMEKMTADLGELYGATNALSVANINTAMAEPPIIPGISYVNAAGASTYIITYTPNAANGGNPTAVNETISSPSPFAGLNGLITPFTLTVTARTVTGSESKLIRTVQAVGIPVFQFGIFSQTDLSYFPGPVFNFGGRVHTNANLWLASGASLTLSDRVTLQTAIKPTGIPDPRTSRRPRQTLASPAGAARRRALRTHIPVKLWWIRFLIQAASSWSKELSPEPA